jgi:hypothetical protein
MCVLAALVGAFLAIGAGGSAAGPRARPCVSGASSIGPVTIVQGRIVGGDATPHASGCVPR